MVVPATLHDGAGVFEGSLRVEARRPVLLDLTASFQPPEGEAIVIVDVEDQSVEPGSPASFTFAVPVASGELQGSVSWDGGSLVFHQAIEAAAVPFFIGSEDLDGPPPPQVR